jgi:hypothetical protein
MAVLEKKEEQTKSNDQDQKLELQYWGETDTSFTLKEGLSEYKKDDLTEIRRFLQLRNASSLRKAELVDLLAEKIPEQIKQTCMLFDEAPFDLLMTLAQNGGQANAEKITHAQAEAWRQTGLLFTGTIEGQRKLLMPQDLVDPVLEFSTDREVKASVKRNREWIQLTKGLLYYYGTLSKEDLVKKVTELIGKSERTFEQETFLTVLELAEMHDDQFYVSGEGYADHRVQDAEWVKREQKMRKDVPFYPFKKKQVLEAGEPGYVDRSGAYRKFIKMLEKDHRVESEKAVQIVNHICNQVNNGKSMNDVLHYFGKQVTLENNEKMTPLLNQLTAVFNNTRQWALKGHTPSELLEEERKHMKPLPEKEFKLQQNEPVKKQKIGRNDPCPCGSGKKYKKCHGR